MSNVREREIDLAFTDEDYEQIGHLLLLASDSSLLLYPAS